MKIVISEHGSFELTNLAIVKLVKLKGLKITPYIPHKNGKDVAYHKVDEEYIASNPHKYIEWLFHDYGNIVPLSEVNTLVRFPDYIDVNMKRNDSALVSVVEELGQDAASYCTLRIVEIPDDVDFYVSYNPHDKSETINEAHRFWPENRIFGNHYINQFYRRGNSF